VRTRKPGGVGAGTGLLGQSPATRLSQGRLFVSIFSVFDREKINDLFLLVY